MVAITFVVAITFISCKEKLTKVNVDAKELPVQTVRNMEAVRTTNGRVDMKMNAPLMERYETKKKVNNREVISFYELFPKGFFVYGYNEKGELETKIEAGNAKHSSLDGEEKWEVFDNVVVRNLINKQRIETDTLYWDKDKRIIYNYCYVQLFSPQSYLQGYNLRSDEMAREVDILKPFNSTYVAKDTLKQSQ